MQIDPSRYSASENYRLLTNLVVPRPIAWVTSLNANGVINLAPFSFSTQSAATRCISSSASARMTSEKKEAV